MAAPLFLRRKVVLPVVAASLVLITALPEKGALHWLIVLPLLGLLSLLALWMLDRMRRGKDVWPGSRWLR
jgi:hypothetical protein